MIKDEITLEDYQIDEILNLSDEVLDTIVYIIKEEVCNKPLFSIDANSIREIIEENWG